MQVYLVMRRTDIPNGVLQQVDLKPNTSSRNLIYTPGDGQTGYVHNIPAPLIATSVAAGPPLVAISALSGVAAYLIGNIDTTAAPGSPVFSSVQADAAAAGIVALAQAGSTLDLPAIDGVLGGIVAGTTLTGGGSTGVLAELLQVLSGANYTIAAGTDISDGAGNFAGRVGDFVDGVYRQLYDADGFIVSNVYGNISKMKSSNFTYAGTTGAAIAVYSETGTVL